MNLVQGLISLRLPEYHTQISSVTPRTDVVGWGRGEDSAIDKGRVQGITEMVVQVFVFILMWILMSHSLFNHMKFEDIERRNIHT